MPDPFHILIVDDEAPARAKIKHFLDKCESEVIIKEASNGAEAIAAIESNRFDAVFLDIQMPEMTGFEVVYNIGIECMPPYVFATAYDDYAIKAFEAHAIDYLLKPFTFDRFKQSFLRLQKQSASNKKSPITSNQQSEPTQNQLLQLLQFHNQQRPIRLTIRHDGKIHLVNPNDLLFIESDEHYLRFHLMQDNPQSKTTELYERGSLKSLFNKLDPDHFKQIHRSTIINLNFIKEIEPLSHGDQSALLTSGHRLTISRRYTQNLGL